MLCISYCGLWSESLAWTSSSAAQSTFSSSTAMAPNTLLTEYRDGSKHPPHKTGYHQQWRLAWQAGQLHAHLMGTSGRFWSPGMVPISRRPQESPRKLESASSERETAVVKRTCFTEWGHQGRVEFRQKNLSHKPDVPANARNPRSYGV